MSENDPHNSFFTLLFFVIIFLVSCTPEIRYKILSTVFDGVPNPAEKRGAVVDTTAIDSTARQRLVLSRGPAEQQYTYHPPFRGKECEACHEVEFGNQLIEPMPNLCYNCHDDLSENFSVLHGPVAAGYCTACHNPHMAKNPKLLRKTERNLCLYCHSWKRLSKTDTHADLEDANCMECHNPHGGEDEYFLE